MKEPVKVVSGQGAEVSDDVGKIIQSFNRACDELHLPELNPIDSPMQVVLDQDEYGNGVGPILKFTDKAYLFTFLQKDGSFLSYHDERLSETLYGLHAPGFDAPDKSKLTEEQAIQEGTAFLKALGPQVRIKLSSPGARFDQKQQNGKYHPGIWQVWWARVDSKGHPFADDRVTIWLPEGHSPTSIAIEQLTEYTEVAGDPLKMKDALDIIQRKIDSDRFWDRAKSFIPGLQSGGWTDPAPTSAYLEIVHPGHQKRGIARLAWVFWFKQHSSHSHYPISFWVDAYTGQIIGGDVVGLDTPD